MNYDEYTDDELEGLRREIGRELERRRTVNDAAQEIDDVVARYQEAIGRKDGDPYEPPTGYLNAYFEGAIVTHDGKEWIATRNGATGVPGESPDWIEKVPEGVIPEWEQRHAGSEYEPGAIVQYEGTIYRNDLEVPNGFRPDVPHSGWTDLGPIEEYEPED